MRLKPVLFALASVLLAGTIQADGIPVKPGKWEMTSTMTMSMMPQPQITTETECIEEDVLDPVTFNMDEENPCDISEVNIESKTASWNISCTNGDGAATEGSWQVTSDGDTLNGQGTMSTIVAGQTFGFEMAWEGKRIGDCD